MRLIDRSFPHPVVGNRDDVTGAAFQMSLHVSSDRDFFYIECAAECSSKTLRGMLKKKQAKYCIHVECSNTLYRHAFSFVDDAKRLDIPARLLHGNVELNAFIVSMVEMPNYRPDDAHPDYGKARFPISHGDVLAVGEGLSFDAEQEYDALRRVGSIMQIVESNEDADHEMKVEFNQPKIVIVLSKSDFKTYSKLKQIKDLQSHLTTTIVLPVLAEALRIITADAEQYEGLRWCEILQHRTEAEGLASADDPLKVAQVLLDNPIRRALATAETYALRASD